MFYVCAVRDTGSISRPISCACVSYKDALAWVRWWLDNPANADWLPLTIVYK